MAETTTVTSRIAGFWVGLAAGFCGGTIAGALVTLG